MEGLLDKLTNFDVSQHANNPNAEHPYFSLYKCKRSGSNQEERRKKILEARQQARYDLLSHLRSIEENEKAKESYEDEDDMSIDNPEAVYKKPREYQDFLMLNEWLVEVPQDFEQDYYALLCPVGKRCLCVCYKGWTTVYAKNGKSIKKFSSLLPGGSNKTKQFGFTIVDCIWSDVTKTFYIIDLVFWYNNSYLHCETTFRFEWLKSRIKEYREDVTVRSPVNKYRFVPLSFYECRRDSLEIMFGDSLLEEVELDGILFYHKLSHYTHGPSPLICWLKPFMLTEILGVSVPQKFMNEKPLHYTNIATHIDEYNKEREEIRVQRNAKRHSNREKLRPNKIEVDQES